MNRTSNVVVNALLNFVVGFAVGSVIKDRSAGVKAGLALAVIGGLASYLLSDRLGEEDDTFFGIDRVRTAEAE
jgi:hypothetical protein